MKKKNTAEKYYSDNKVESRRAHFDQGVFICAPALVVDKFGYAWWVDPIQKTITKAQP